MLRLAFAHAFLFDVSKRFVVVSLLLANVKLLLIVLQAPQYAIGEPPKSPRRRQYGSDQCGRQFPRP